MVPAAGGVQLNVNVEEEPDPWVTALSPALKFPAWVAALLAMRAASWKPQVENDVPGTVTVRGIAGPPGV